MSNPTVLSPEDYYTPVLVLQGVVRTFRQGRQKLEVLRGVDLEIAPGEIVGLVGPSGAGKSTLLHIAGLLEAADGGETYVCGEACSEMNDDERTKARRNHLGFVYQYHHLLPEFSAIENVMIPQIISGFSHKDARDRSKELLVWMGLAAREAHRPARLSGGEQQRVAIARAIATTPKLLLADEPTGNLDPHTADEVFNVLLKLAREANLSALIATHNPDLTAKMDRVIRMEDGLLVPY
jgi:lipoprotein-releasing system ATP-binding protein